MTVYLVFVCMSVAVVAAISQDLAYLTEVEVKPSGDVEDGTHDEAKVSLLQTAFQHVRDSGKESSLHNVSASRSDEGEMSQAALVQNLTAPPSVHLSHVKAHIRYSWKDHLMKSMLNAMTKSPSVYFTSLLGLDDSINEGSVSSQGHQQALSHRMELAVGGHEHAKVRHNSPKWMELAVGPWPWRHHGICWFFLTMITAFMVYLMLVNRAFFEEMAEDYQQIKARKNRRIAR